MRPGYIGFALAWIVFTFVTSYRLFLNAPWIFFVFLFVPVLILLYGLFADGPAARKGGQQGAPGPVQPGGGAGVPAEIRTSAPAHPPPPPPLPPPPPPAAVRDTGRPAYRDAFAYAKGAVAGNRKQWALLILATILLLVPLSGYLMKVLRGGETVPEVKGWKDLAADGVSAILIATLYLLPSGVVMLAMTAALQAAVYTHGGTLDSLTFLMVLAGAPAFLLLALTALVFIPVALLRFARTGRIGEAFRFGEVSAAIRRIGLLSYVPAVILITAVNYVFLLLAAVPPAGLVIFIVLFPPAAVFEARFICLLHDRAGRM